ncbi:hypothetical protein [Limosilactobacillus reuteri]|uniref:hypothetical protein n=1 Tax=Limosilactobacillus reuteri TaxID=1598 RepID=UPI002B061409|nr:hypothetical protein [Limosilactobacillus reuteri]
MAKIDNVSTNDMNFKHLDTTKDIIITPKGEFGNSVRLNASHTWTAKVSDGTNYVGDYPVTLKSTDIVVNSAGFTKLPAGNYHLEVWEEWIDSNGKKQCSIYPSPQRTIDFSIYQNITDLAENEIKHIGFQDVVDQAVMNIGMNYVFKVNMIEPDQNATVVQAAADGKNYVTFNIPRGAKGDKGDKGDKGVQGIQGAKGDPGDRGPDGKQGPKGDPGERGPQGVQGQNGHTPVRGVDYWTDADQKAIVDNLKATANGLKLNIDRVTTEVKNDVDRLGDTVKSTGSRNLLHNTSDRYKTLTGNGYLTQSTASDIYTSTANYHGGDWFTYAATITNNSSKNVTLETWLFDQNKQGLDANSIAPIQLATHSTDVYPGEKDKRVSTSFQISGTTWFIRTYVIFDGGGAPNGSQVQVKDERLVEGKLDGSWSPNPDDINKKIDTQTLDSANIDDLKTQGHYFVRNLTGNPIGGWVYVDVTGNNNDRVRQDVYQDNGDKHMSRRLFGNSWSGWEQGAYISDVNNVKTEVTASVKNLGDRVTTQVNSITSKVNNVDGKVNNMKIGGRNLLKGTRDFNSKYWYQDGDSTFLEDNPVDSSVKEIHSYGDCASFRYKQTIQLDPNKNYMISADIAIYDNDGNGLYVAPYGTIDGQGGNLAGTGVNLAGFPRQVKREGFRRIYLPVTAHGRTLKDFRIEGHGNWSAGKGSVFIHKFARIPLLL